MGTIFLRLKQTLDGVTASLLGALLVSTSLTLAVAVPLVLNADSASDEDPTALEAVALGDDRFPLPISLDDSQLGLAGGEDELEVAAATVIREVTPEATATISTPEPTSTTVPETAEAAPKPTSRPDADELAGVFPTPTTEALPTPRPQPTRTPVPSTPTPSVSPPPTPSLTPAPKPATPTPPTPAEEATTDVFAFVFDATLTEGEVGVVSVKAANAGDEDTTDVSMTLTASGATILAVAPARPDWACVDTGEAWVCTAARLERGSVSLGAVTVQPYLETVTISVTVTHALTDPDPGNNTQTKSVVVVPKSGAGGTEDSTTPGN